MDQAAEALSPEAESAPAEAPSQQSQAWHGGLDEQVRTFADSKGWLDDNPTSAMQRAVESYRNAEKMIGGRVKIPEAGDEDAWGDLYNRLGRPETPDSYELKSIPEGANEQMVGWFKETAHKVGMNPIQAETFLNQWNEFNGNIANEQSVAMEANVERELSQLRNEWGPDYDSNIQSGRRAVQLAGLEPNDLDGIEQAIGSARMLKMFAAYGKSLGEDEYVDSGSTASKGRAEEQLAQLKNDPNFMARYLRGDQDSVAQFDSLMQKIV